MEEPVEILFVDDEPFVLHALERAMSKLLDGYKLTFISDPTTALEAAQKNPPAVIVSDQRMPELEGLSLVSKLRETVTSTKAIMLTGTTDLDLTLTAINTANVFRFYTKPCEPNLLAEGIEDAVEAWRRSTGRTKAKISLSERIGAAALNHLRLAIIVLDANARVQYVNSAGAELFAKEDGLHWGHEEICRASTPEQTKRLHELIAAAANNNLDELNEGIMAVTRPDMRRALCLAISPLEDGSGNMGGYAVMFVSDPDRPIIPDPEAIANLFGLTPSEANLTHALVIGERIEKAAEANDITVSTARTYLKQIFQKTQTNRQADLIRLVLTAGSNI